jgi:hypothetical protein
VFGTALNWVDSAIAGTRDEYNLEVFYRFPIIPKLDLTASYQGLKGTEGLFISQWIKGDAH